MKVKELIEKLEKFDQNLEVFCYTEDENILDEGHLFKLFMVESVEDMTGEGLRGEDEVPTINFVTSKFSRKYVTLSVTGVF